MAHIVVIGRSLQEIYKTKNYVGKEVDDYFCSTLWSEYLDSIIKPEATRFDKLLAAVNPRQRLHKKVTLGDLFFDSHSSVNGDQFHNGDSLQTAVRSSIARANEDVEEHMVKIDPNSLDNNSLDPDLQRDLEEIVKGTSHIM